MLLRQVQARPLQGHHLRALRRRGDAPEGAPRAHGPHRPGRARLAHLVLQGRPEPHRLPARHRAARAREGSLLRRLDRHLGRHRGAPEGPERPRGQGQGRVRADLRRPRREPRRARGPAQAAPRRTSPRASERNFDEDDDFWGRGLSNWAEEQGVPTLEEVRELVGEDVRRGRQPDHDGGLEEDPRARPQLGDPRRPPPLAEGARDGRERRDPDPRGARAALQGARQGDRLQEGRDHQAHQPRARRPARQEGLGARGGRRARRERRPEAAREGARPRQGAAARGARARPTRARAPTTCAS